MNYLIVGARLVVQVLVASRGVVEVVVRVRLCGGDYAGMSSRCATSSVGVDGGASSAMVDSAR